MLTFSVFPRADSMCGWYWRESSALKPEELSDNSQLAGAKQNRMYSWAWVCSGRSRTRCRDSDMPWVMGWNDLQNVFPSEDLVNY